MTRLLLMLLLCAAVRAEPPPVYRFLIVVDTSQSMSSRKPAAIQAVRELVRSGFDGQIAEGDTFDLWTFSSELQPGRFPTQVWSPARSNLLAEIPAQYLDSEKFVGRTRFQTASAPISAWVRSQPHALLFLFTDGEDPILDLPFDLEFNEAIAPLKKQYRSSRRLFLASILVRNGRATDWRLHAGEQAPAIPRLPERKFEVPVLPVVANPEPPVQKAEPPAEPEPEPIRYSDLPPGSRIVPVPVLNLEPEATRPLEPVVAAVTLDPEPEPVLEPEPEPEPEPAQPILAPEPQTEPVLVHTEKSVAEPEKQTLETNPPVAAGPVLPPVTGTVTVTRSPAPFIIGGASLLLLLAIFYFRRKPKGPAASLISRSLNQ